MPFLTANGCRYHVIDTGAPHEGAETVFFGHGYLMTHRMFEPQIEALRGRYRCVTLDWRGQGETEVVFDGYDPWQLARDAAAVIEGLKLGSVHYVGFSMGGYVGIRLALLRPDLVRSLALLDTSAGATEGAKWLKYQALLWALRLVGFGPLLGQVLPILFGSDFMQDPGRDAERARWRERIASNSRVGVFRAGRGIFSRDDVLDRLPEIEVPTLLLVGEHDAPHPPAEVRANAERLPNATFEIIPGAGHSPPIETPGRVTEALTQFLDRQGAS